MIALGIGILERLYTAPTSISPVSLSFDDTQNTGETIATFTANEPNCTFSKVGGLSQAVVATDGKLSLSASVGAGAYTLDVRADNSAAGGGSYDATVAITVNNTAVTPTADYTEQNLQTAASLINSWGGTVPDGRPIVIEIEGGTGSESDPAVITMTGQFDHRITIRPTPGSFSQSVDANGIVTGGNGCKVLGRVIVAYTHNLHFYRMHIERGNEGGRNNGVFDNRGAVNFTAEECWLSQAPLPYDVDGRYEDRATMGECLVNEGGNPLGQDATTNSTYLNCLLTWSRTDTFRISAANNLTIEGCVMNWSRVDNFKYRAATVVNGVINRRNWFPVHKPVYYPLHPDGQQSQGGVLTDREHRGNFFWACRISPGSVEEIGQQIWFDQGDKGAIIDQNVYEQNLCYGNQDTGIQFTPYPSLGGSINNCSARYNDILPSEMGAAGSPQKDPVTLKPGAAGRPYIQGNPGTGYTQEGNLLGDPIGGAGGNTPALIYPSDVQITVGSAATTWNNSYGDYEWARPGTPGFQGMHSGRPNTDQNDIGWLEPPVGSQAHWDHASPVGGYLRKKEIFQDGVHPEAHGWPVAGAFRAWFNSQNSLGESWDGVSYAPNGDKA